MEKQEIPSRNDPVALWKRATVDDENKFIGFPRPNSSLMSKPKEIFMQRPLILTSLSQMTPNNQVSFMKKLVQNWPFKAEKRAIIWPLHGGIVVNSITSTFIATRINAEIFLMKANTPFLDAFKQCPKIPSVMAIYASGVAFFAMYNVFIQKIVLREGSVCSPCVLIRNLSIALTTGVALPLITTPYLSYYMLLQRGEGKFPLVKNYIDFLTLSWIGARAATPILSRLVVLQCVTAFLSTAFTIWGRNRLFATAEVDPEIVKEIMIEGQERNTVKAWLRGHLQKTPILGQLVEDPTEEK